MVFSIDNLEYQTGQAVMTMITFDPHKQVHCKPALQSIEYTPNPPVTRVQGRIRTTHQCVF